MEGKDKKSKYNLDPSNLTSHEKLLTSAKEFSLFLLQIRSRTQAQLKKKLEDKKYYTEEVIDECIKDLKKYGYIDDNAYCERYIELNKTSKSYRVMRLKLYQKGIPNDILDKYFNSKDEEDLIKKEKDESETARKLLEKKVGDLSLLKDMEFKEKSKLFAFLARKGFSYDIIEHLFR